MNKHGACTDWNKKLDIPASGIVFASGGSLIGAAAGGPAGSAIGAVSGIFIEVASQKIHRARERTKEASE